MIIPKKNLKNLVRVEPLKTTRLDFLRLDKNENIIELGDDFINKVVSNINSNLISAYPEVHEIYTKLSQWLNIEYGNIFVTAGSDAAIKSVFEVFINEGDEIITLHPTYAMYYVYSEMFGAYLKKIEYNQDLSLDYLKIIQAITDKSRLICIANPNSPTGTIIERTELLEIIKIAQEKDILVLIDEAYFLYYPETFIRDVTCFSNLIVTRSFTKAYGLASARLGFAVSNPYIISCLKKVRPIYEVNSFSILLGKLIIDNEKIILENMKRFNEGKIFLIDELKSLGLNIYTTHANFLLIDMRSSELAMLTKQELYNRKILISAGYTNEPMNRCIRISISEKKHMQKFIENLREIMKLNPGFQNE